MPTKMFGTVRAGATSVSLDVLLLKTTDNTAETGLTKSSLTVKYYRSTPTGGAITDITSSLSDLSTLATAFTMFGVKEIGYGSYRLDAPDAMWDLGADWVELTVVTSNSLYKERFTLETNGTQDIVELLPANFSAMAIDSSGRVDIGSIKGTASTGTAGYVGIDWSHVNAPTATVGLSGTTVGTATAVGSVSGSVGSVTGAVGSVTGNVGGNVTGSVGSVLGSVASVTGNIGGNVAGSVGSVSGAVGSVTAGVTLAAAGLDAVIVETAAGAQAAINARQALSLIVCASPAGIVTGAATTTITVKNPGKGCPACAL